MSDSPASAKPPPYVPTLTQVVRNAPAVAPTTATSAPLSAEQIFEPAQLDQIKAKLQTHLLSELRKQVSAQLPLRVREAIAQQVLVHTQQALRQLQADVDKALQQAVQSAIDESVKEAVAKLAKNG